MVKHETNEPNRSEKRNKAKRHKTHQWEPIEGSIERCRSSTLARQFEPYKYVSAFLFHASPLEGKHTHLLGPTYVEHAWNIFSSGIAQKQNITKTLADMVVIKAGTNTNISITTASPIPSPPTPPIASTATIATILPALRSPPSGPPPPPLSAPSPLPPTTPSPPFLHA